MSTGRGRRGIAIAIRARIACAAQQHQHPDREAENRQHRDEAQAASEMVTSFRPTTRVDQRKTRDRKDHEQRSQRSPE